MWSLILILTQIALVLILLALGSNAGRADRLAQARYVSAMANKRYNARLPMIIQ